MNYNRVTWLDVAKCIGIVLIYLGHFRYDAGLFYEYVFKFHVPLFFFLAGCSCTYEKELSFTEFLKKKALRILIPFYVFAFLALITNCIWIGPDHVVINLITIAFGCIRNCYCAEGLWFLTCLFVIEIAFKAVRMIKSKTIRILLIVLIILLKPLYGQEPRFFFNIDSIYYILYFALGYYLYPAFNALFENPKNRKYHILLFLVTGSFAFIELFDSNPGDNFVIPISWINTICTTVISSTRAFVLIIFTILLSRCLCNVRFMQKIGSDTLYLCGMEYIMKQFIFGTLGLFGFDKSAGIPWSTYIYVSVLIVIGTWLVSPLMRRLIKQLQKLVVRLFQKYYKTKKLSLS